MGGRDAGPYWLAARLRKRLRCEQRKMFSPSLLSAHSILPAWRYRLRNSVQQKLYHLCCYYSRKLADVNSFFEISPVKNRWQMLAIPAARHIARWEGDAQGHGPWPSAMGGKCAAGRWGWLRPCLRCGFVGRVFRAHGGQCLADGCVRGVDGFQLREGFHSLGVFVPHTAPLSNAFFSFARARERRVLTALGCMSSVMAVSAMLKPS